MPHPKVTPAVSFPPAPKFAIEDLGNDQLKYLLTLYDEGSITAGATHGIYARGGPGVLASRINCAYNQGGDPGTSPTNDYAEYSAGLMPIEGLQQPGVTWPPETVFFVPPDDVKQFGIDWKQWFDQWGHAAKHAGRT